MKYMFIITHLACVICAYIAMFADDPTNLVILLMYLSVLAFLCYLNTK